MDISAFLTQQAAPSGKAGNAAASGNGQGVSTGVAFMDLIFAQLTATTANEDGNKETAEKENHVLLSKLAEKLAREGVIETNSQPDYEGHVEPLTSEQILEAILEGPGVDATELNIDAKTTGQGTEVQINATPDIAAARKKLVSFLESLIAAVPQENKADVIAIEPGQIKNILGRLQIEISEGDSPALIATGLTPEKLTDIIQDIVDGNEQGEALVIGQIRILPPEAKKEAIFLPRGVVIAQPQHPAGEVSTPGAQQKFDGTIGKLSDLISSGYEGNIEEGDFDGVLRVLERAQGRLEAGGKNAPGLERAAENIKQMSAGLSTVQGNIPALSQMFTSFAVDSIYPEGMDFAGTPGQSMSLNGAAQFTSMVGHAPQAGQPHPATQMIAATIAKATTNGETKNISIQLDPPDLGKVKVSMDFNKDKGSIKIHMIAEKPETYLMMQRDAQALERALQDAGLDADGSSLEFEFSQDGNMFAQDEHSTGGHSGGGSSDASGAEDGEEMEIIEAKMDWYVDPQSGLTRYDALV